MSGINGSSSGSNFPAFDYSLLSGYYSAKTQLLLTQNPSSGAKTSTAASSKAVNTAAAPWDPSHPKQSDTSKLTQAMQTTSFVDLENSTLNQPGVSADARKLFALYTGLTNLQALASKSAADGTLSGERNGLDTRFQNGIDQIKAFVSGDNFDDMSMLFGSKAKTVNSGLAIPRAVYTYQGKAIVQGASSTAISGLTGTEVFNVSVTKSGGTVNVPIDLSQIGGPPSIDNIVAYMNQQMQAAGLVTRFSRDTFDGNTADAAKSYGIAVQNVATEKVSFSAPASSPAVYVAGVSGSGTTQTAQLVKLTDQGTSVATDFSAQIAPKTGTADVRGSATDTRGNTYVVGTVSGDLDQASVQGAQDVYLRKYDSAGQVVWSHLLGSSTSADGFGVAVDNNGNVAIAGRVTDRLTSTGTGGGSDSFVTKYNAQGDEVFTRQVAPVLDDQANALTFGADGSLYIAGQTKGSMASGLTSAGGTDAYLQKLTAKGSLVYTRQLGTSGDDRANAVSVDGDGNVVLATVESGNGVVRKFADDGTSAAIWQENLGNLGAGTIGGIALDGGSAYVSGSTTNADLTAGGEATIAAAHNGGSDGFVMKLDDAGSSVSANFVSYIGTSGSDGAANVAVANGDIYVAGSTNGSLTGGTAPTSSNAYVAKLDNTGTQVWVHQYAGSAGTGAARALSVDPQGGSVLDTLGLPQSISQDQSRSVTAQSTARPGDFFFVSVNGLSPHKVTIQAGDTLQAIATRITAALSLKGTAKVLHGASGDELTISANSGSVIQLTRGDASFDALAGLGIDPGKIYNPKSGQATATDAKDKNVFALGLTPTLSLNSQTHARLAASSINAALDAVRNAYKALTQPASSTTTATASGGTTSSGASSVSAQRQVASYQSALAILGGGSTG